MTAVEWLLENLISEPLAEEHFKHNKECWNKAEEMEKQQIMNAWLVDGYTDISDDNWKAEYKFSEQKDWNTDKLTNGQRLFYEQLSNK